MASGSESDSQRETILSTASVAPPRLPPPPGFQSSHVRSSEARPWSGSGSFHAFLHASEVPSYEDDSYENRSAGSRHLRLPPLDTSQISHRSVSTDQLSNVELDHHPSKRRRVEEPEGGGPPNLVSRSDSIADSSRLRTHADSRQDQHQEPHLHTTRYRLDPPDHAGAPTQKRNAWDSHAAQASRNAVCCSPGCQGPTCSRLRSIVQDLVTEICTRDPLVSGATSSSEFLPPKPILPEATEIDTGDALEWALQRLRWNNASLKNLLNIDIAQSETPSSLFRLASSFNTPLDRMKRQHETVDKDIESSSQQYSRQFPPQPDQSSQTSTLGQQDSWRSFEAMDPPGQPPSRHYRSASFSYGPAMPSPSQPAQAPRMLPSPSSLNLPIPPNLPSISSPSPVTSSSAHLAHLQDLQHQVSVKQLALQTLQREYDSLLQKLERQRVKSQALEKKFEVSDAEINTLTEEKERLANQVLALEAQVEELQVARDEARKMGADSAAQYMKIVEMAGRLQGKGVEDRKQWEKERDSLLKRITELEVGQASPLPPSRSATSHHGQLLGQSSPIQYLSEHPPAAASFPIGSPPAQPDETASLRQEILELKDRIAALEAALKDALEESKAVRAAALTLATAGQRLETSAASALGDASKSEGQQHF